LIRYEHMFEKGYKHKSSKYVIMTTLKTCLKCKQERNVTAFNRNRTKVDGLSTECKDCIREYSKRYRNAHKSELTSYAQAYYAKNTDRVKARVREYEKSNKNKVSARMKVYSTIHKDTIVARTRDWRRANRTQVNKYFRDYYKSNKTVINRRQRLYRRKHRAIIDQYEAKNKHRLTLYRQNYYQKNKSAINQKRWVRMRDDPVFRLRMNLGRRVRALLGRRKSARTMDYVGCSQAFLSGWITWQSSDGMTLKNVHIDHVRPCASFNLADTSQQYECFNWSNLQPLRPKDNLQKSARKDRMSEELQMIKAHYYASFVNPDEEMQNQVLNKMKKYYGLT
jgi:hypothetical protein